jgi:hypothetical protein
MPNDSSLNKRISLKTKEPEGVQGSTQGNALPLHVSYAVIGKPNVTMLVPHAVFAAVLV